MNLVVLRTVACQEKRSSTSKHILPMYSTTVRFGDSKKTYGYSALKLLVSSSVFSLFRTLEELSISHDRSTSYSISLFRSQETPVEGQPPALPPKQFKKNSWNQIHHSHSQQELDNHINETFDIPTSPEKSTVSFLIQLNNSALYWN